jgi:hypothetical protein
VFDGENRAPTPQSTQQGAYVAHPAVDTEPAHPPKSHADLISMPNTNRKDSLHSSYSTSHTGQSPAPGDVATPSPNITFQSHVMFEDGEKNRAPRQSTQQENYVTFPLPDNTPHPPPKSHDDLISMPNVDQKDSFHSSYSTSHTGQLSSPGDAATPSPNITFQSRVAFEDGDKNRMPHQSTQRENYVSYPVQEHEPHHQPKAQMDLSMPNVDPKDSHSSYKSSYTGESPSPGDVATPSPNITFHSRVAFEDGDKNKTPQQSTQRENYVAYPSQEHESHPPPKGQMDLSMPNLDPKDMYQSSYKHSHTGTPFLQKRKEKKRRN